MIRLKFVELREFHSQRISSEFDILQQTSIMLKIKYPDGFSSQVYMSPSHPISHLYEHIIASNRDLNTNFRIFSSYPKKHLSTFSIESHPDQRPLEECSIDQSQVIMI
ncbi:hypothetical protein HZS_4549, partial [Henneguya salminicola]